MTTVIYLLCDPRYEVSDYKNFCAYIGKTCKSPEVRLAGHIYEASGRLADGSFRATHFRARWIRRLFSLNLRPVLFVAEIVPDEVSWQSREIAWIKLLRDKGCNLKNIRDGGDGPSSEDWRVLLADPEFKSKWSKIVSDKAIVQWSSEALREQLARSVSRSWDGAEDRRKKASQIAKVQVVSQWQDPAFAEKALSALHGARVKSQRRCVHLDTGLIFDSLKDAALFIGYGKKMTYLVLLRWGIRYTRDFE